MIKIYEGSVRYKRMIEFNGVYREIEEYNSVFSF